MENLIYLNEEAVNEELISRHGGELTERVERISKTTGISGEVGGEVAAPIIGPLMGKLKAAVSANYEKGEEEEFVYNLQDNAAKFELLMEVLNNSDAAWVEKDLSKAKRDDLRMDAPVVLDAPIVRTALGELAEQFEISDSTKQMEEGVRELSESGLLDEEEQTELMELGDKATSFGQAAGGFHKILSSMSSEDVYRLPLGPESDVEFVMKLREKWLGNPPFTFPSLKSDYITVGKITSKVDKQESEEFISWLEFIDDPSNDRNSQRVKTKQLKTEFAEMASEQLERDVDASEFDMTYPDVQIHPLAIYSLN